MEQQKQGFSAADPAIERQAMAELTQQFIKCLNQSSDSDYLDRFGISSAHRQRPADKAFNLDGRLPTDHQPLPCPACRLRGVSHHTYLIVYLTIYHIKTRVGFVKLSAYQRQSAIALDRYDLEERTLRELIIEAERRMCLRGDRRRLRRRAWEIFSENGNRTKENQWR